MEIKQEESDWGLVGLAVILLLLMAWIWDYCQPKKVEEVQQCKPKVEKDQPVRCE